MKFDLQKNFEKRENNNLSQEDWEKIVKTFDYSKSKMTLTDLKKYINFYPKVFRDEQISQREMQEDFKQYKFFIEYFYIGYKFFGEKFFENSFRKIQSFIEKHKEATPKEFAEIIVDSLQGLADSHFGVFYNNTKNGYIKPRHENSFLATFYNAELDIEHKDDYFYINGQRIVKINGEEPNKYIKQVCDINGNFKLGIIARLKEQKANKIELEYETAGGKTQKFYVNRKFNSKEIKSEIDKIPSDSKVGKIIKDGQCLYIRNTSCAANPEILEQFLENLKKENHDVDYYVIDICGNGGGNDSVPNGIMEEILELDNFRPGYRYITLASRCYDPSKEHSIDYNINKIMTAYNNSRAKHYTNIGRIVGTKAQNTLNNNKLVFVIADNASASAAECYQEYYSCLPNVVFVNDNTMGCKHFGGVQTFGLNNSCLQLRFGSKFWVHDKSYMETQGLEPDIYFACKSHQDVLTTMKNFIKKNIKTKNNDKEKIK